MKYSVFCGFLALLASSGCGPKRVDAPKPARPAGSAGQRPSAAEAVVPVGQNGADSDEAPRTTGGTVYGEVVAATDEMVAALDRAPADLAAAAELRRAVRRFEAAARNWTIYLANTGDAEIGLLRESRLARHAEASEEKLRQGILLAARDPAADSLSGELRHLLRVWRESLSAHERAEFERWVAENELPF